MSSDAVDLLRSWKESQEDDLAVELAVGKLAKETLWVLHLVFTSSQEILEHTYGRGRNRHPGQFDKRMVEWLKSQGVKNPEKALKELREMYDGLGR